ncbi:MAG TPA: ChaN family lipoprotein [Thermoanaerobaculia bacterium]
MALKRTVSRLLALLTGAAPAVLTAALLAPAPAPAQEGVLHLAVGDPARRDREVPLVLDAVADTRTGELLSPADLAGRLASARLVLVGESHTSMDFHRAQLRLIQELAATGREVLVGLEMYPYTHQEHLDRWVAGLLTEEGFLELSDWYDAWGYHWDYYRDVFLLARDRGLPLVALNTPREVVTAVRKEGFENLSPEERAHVPESIDLDSEEHRTLFRAFFEEDGEGLHAGMSDEQLEAMFAAQVTWDATMAWNAVKALEARGGEGAVMVVLVGSGHLAYGLGIQRQAARWLEGGAGAAMATVIPIPVEDEDGERVETVRASYADFVWGLPPAGEPLYPALGLSTTAVSDDDPRRRVLFVPEDSVAAAAGFQPGDVVVAMDGRPLPDRRTFNRRMAGTRWGDRVAFTVERAGQPVELTAWLRRQPPAPATPAARPAAGPGAPGPGAPGG